ncbi:MAG: hypothetical protein IPG71_09330 [bacterium]|nr:hypothetical protein [bacterium]
MEPKDYNEIIKTVDLTGFRLSAVESKLVEQNLPAQMSAKFDLDYVRSDKVGENDYLVTTKCSFLAFGATESEIIVDIKADYVSTFVSPNVLTDEFFEIFKSTTLKVIAWPYFRELVSGTLAKMGMPVFTLPMVINTFVPDPKTKN